jgi:hypothetical protein
MTGRLWMLSIIQHNPGFLRLMELAPREWMLTPTKGHWATLNNARRVCNPKNF